MIRFLSAFLLLFACLANPAEAQKDLPRIVLKTSAGDILIEVDTKRAPITANNFLAYVEDKRFDGTTFYRAARNRKDPKRGLVQGGINHRVVRTRLPIAHEPTSRTGLRHIDGTVSMARNAPGTAMGDFFVTVGPASYLDARQGTVGYAAFGRVVSGMDVVRRMLAAPTYPGGRSENTIGQSIRDPIRIVSARRVR